MDMDELSINRQRQNAAVTADEQAEQTRILEQTRIWERDQFLDRQVLQSKASHQKRDTERNRRVREFFRKKEAPVVTDDQTYQRELENVNVKVSQRIGQFQDQLKAAGLLELPGEDTMAQAPMRPEMIDASQEAIGTTKKLQKEVDNQKLSLVTVEGKYKDAPLFEKMPDLADVQQGRVGDCYFMASIASVIQSDPVQLLKNMKDNGDNTVTVRFFRKRTRKSYNRERQKKDFQALNDKTDDAAFAQMKPADKLQFLLQRVQYGQAVNEGSFVPALQSILPYYSTTLKHNGKGLGDFLMESKDGMAKFFQDITQKATIDEALQALYATDDAHFTFFMSSWLDYTNLIQADTRINYLSDYPGDSDTVTQEVYVTVSKDLTEQEVKQHGDVKKTEPIYAKGPLWVRLLEKAYAASGLNQLQGSDDDKALTELNRSYEGIVGGWMSDSFQHLTDRKSKRAATFASNETDNTLVGAMEKAFGIKDWKQKVQQEFHLSEKQVDDLEQALKKEDMSQLKLTAKEKEKYREQAVGLDDLIRAILSSKIKFDSGNQEEQRRALAFQMSSRLAGSGTSRLQFARFSGQYTKNAKDVLQKIKDRLAKGKPVGASSAVFLPKSVSSGGLNGEAIAGGVVEKHAYTVLATRTIDDNEFLVLRNPWASGVNLYRRRGDGTVVDELDRRSKNNGVFLVELNDFLRKFDHVEGVSDK